MKSEDTFCYDSSSSAHFTEALGESLSSVKVIAGVFDGHDGPAMSDYCAEGMIGHVVEELKTKVNTTSHHTHIMPLAQP